MKEKEPVKLREKKVANGKTSLYLDIYYNGKRCYEFLGLYLVLDPKTRLDKENNAKTLTIANTIKSKRIVELYNGEYGLNKNTNSDVNLIEYVEYVARTKRDLGKVGLYQVLQPLLLHLEKYCRKNVTVQSVDKKFLNGFIQHLKKVKHHVTGLPLKQKTQFNYYSYLKICLHQAIKDEIITVDPTKTIDPISNPESHKEYLNIEEIKMLIETPCKKNGVKRSFLFCCFCGLRYSDVKLLKWGDIQRNNHGELQIVFCQKKTKKEICLPLSANAIAQLPDRGISSDKDPVFDMLSSSQTNLTLRRWAKNAGINKYITFHSSRHTCATLLISFGSDLYAVKEILGHQDIKTTQIYAKLVNKNKRDAINLVPSMY